MFYKAYLSLGFDAYSAKYLAGNVKVVYEISQRLACSAVRRNRTVLRYESIRHRQYALIDRMD